MTIYTSLQKPVPTPATSVWTYVFSRTHPYSTYSLLSPSLPAFIDADTGFTLTRGELRSLTLRLAYGIRHPPAQMDGAKRGDTALVFSPNSIVYPVVMYGLIAAGVTVSLANPAYTSTELAHRYADSGSHLIFAPPSLMPVVFEMMKQLGVGEEEARRRVIVMRYDGKGMKTQGKGPEASLVWLEQLLVLGEQTEEEKFDGEQTAQETVYLCFSSGTTGKPKGVMTTHHNMTSQLQVIKPLLPITVLGKDVYLGTLPFYHIFALTNALHVPIIQGAPVIVMPRYEPNAFCKNIATYRVTLCFVVPPILLALAHHPATTQHNMTSLRYLCCAAAPLSNALASACLTKLKSVGADLTITQGYGLTETSPATFLLPLEDSVRKLGSVGPLVPNHELRLVVADDDVKGVPLDVPTIDVTEEPRGGKGVRMSARGELWVRGPCVMKGYLGNEAATRDAITPDGWFKTGDIAVCDEEGFWYIVDRKKELIKYKGFQVAPAELEGLLHTHPKILDVAVIGVDDPERATELPRAYVVPASPPASAAEFEKEIQQWVQQRVAQHKRLRGGVKILSTIPRSAAGKILRVQLRDLAKQEDRAQVKAKF